VRVLLHRLPMPPTRRSLLLSNRLDRDWDTLCRRPDTVARARAWGVTDEPFADLDELLGRAGFRAPASPDADALLRRLLVLGRDDELAARVVLQRILPGLVAAAMADARDGEARFEEVVGVAWMAIRERRRMPPHDQVAANLVRGAIHRAFTAPRRRRSWSEVSTDPHTLDQNPAVEVIGPCEELAMLLADARAHGIATADLDLVRDLVLVGSPGRVAALREVTPRTIRNHRDKATVRLRRIALSAA